MLLSEEYKRSIFFDVNRFNWPKKIFCPTSKSTPEYCYIAFLSLLDLFFKNLSLQTFDFLSVVEVNSFSMIIISLANSTGKVKISRSKNSKFFFSRFSDSYFVIHTVSVFLSIVHLLRHDFLLPYHQHVMEKITFIADLQWYI